MNIIVRINKILVARNWEWADLARAMGMSEQRLNNWKNRSVPAGQLRNIERALGIARYSLEDESQDDETIKAVADFSWVYDNANETGRAFLRSAVQAVRQAYVNADRRS